MYRSVYIHIWSGMTNMFRSASAGKGQINAKARTANSPGMESLID